MEMKTKQSRPWETAGAAALLVIGFAAGGVMADTKAAPSNLSTLFQAIQRIHQAAGTDVVWTGSTQAARTFDPPSGATEVQLSKTAKAYGRDSLRISGVYVLDPALPDDGSVKERAKALQDYLMQTLPTAPEGAGQREYYGLFAKHMLDTVKGLNGQLPIGRTPFTSLTPQQQQMALDALRAAQINGSLGTINSGLDYLQHPH